MHGDNVSTNALDFHLQWQMIRDWSRYFLGFSPYGRLRGADEVELNSPVIPSHVDWNVAI